MGIVRALPHPQVHLRRAIDNGPQPARALAQFNLGNVIVPYRYAVTSRSNEAVTIPKAASPQNRIAHEKADDDEHVSVNTISLNDIVSNNGISHIGLLKMDCEGSEYEILASISKSTFSKIDRIIVEYPDGKAAEIDEDLKRHGFKLPEAGASDGKNGHAAVQEKLSDE
jgi:FkbM family methyltransferase